MNREKFLQDKHTLFWYIQDLSQLSDNSIVETILNYGDWQDFKDMISLLGLSKIAQIFQQDIQKPRITIDQRYRIISHYISKNMQNKELIF